MKGIWFRVQGLGLEGRCQCPHSIGFNRNYKCATVRECRLDEKVFKMKGF